MKSKGTQPTSLDDMIFLNFYLGEIVVSHIHAWGTLGKKKIKKNIYIWYLLSISCFLKFFHNSAVQWVICTIWHRAVYNLVLCYYYTTEFKDKKQYPLCTWFLSLACKFIAVCITCLQMRGLISKSKFYLCFHMCPTGREKRNNSSVAYWHIGSW